MNSSEKAEGKVFLPQVVWLIWLISLILHIFAGLNSAGVAHLDEHYQILEFVNYKLGLVSIEKLPWEFGFRMRAWFQPGHYYSLAKLVSFLNGSWDPFLVAKVCRVATAILGWVSLVCLWRWFVSAKDLSRGKALSCAVILAFFYFHFFLHSRTSGENLSGSLFILGLVLVPRPQNGQGQAFIPSLAFLSGIFLGFSFEARFQMGFALVGLGLWMLLQRVSMRIWLLEGSGFCLALLVSAFLDYWGYGQWSFPPWNYFFQNIVLHKANNWGTSPYWYYFQAYLREMPFRFGILIMVGWLLGCVSSPLNPVSLIVFSFIFSHALVAHKEARFLYPIVPFGLLGFYVFIESSVASWIRKLHLGSLFHRCFRIIPALILITLNGFLVLRTCFTPFSTRLAIMEEAFLRSSPKANVILFDREDPGILFHFEQSYYTPQPLRRVKVLNLPPTELEFHQAKESGAKVFVYTFRKRGELKDLAEFEKCWVVRSLADDAGLALIIPGVPLSIQDDVMVRQLWECRPSS